MKNLQGKAILVCGGASGIGAATARRLVEEGAQLGIGDFNIEGAGSLASALRSEGGEVNAWQYDQADEASIQALVKSFTAKFGRMDGLFANVADLQTVLVDGDLLSNDSGVWQRTLQVNVLGTVTLLRAALPAILEGGGGSIVCTSSSASMIGEAERPAYAVSKAGIEALCRHVSSRWGKEGVRCNAIAPGFTLTEQLDANMTQEMKDWMLKGANSPRHGVPEDIAGAVAFLLSDDGQWVNGQSWHVNGGVHYGN